MYKLLSHCRQSLSLYLVLLLISCFPLNAQLWQTPEPLRASGPIFSNPASPVLTSDGLYLFVADTGNDLIQILRPGSLNSIGVLGLRSFNSPTDIAFDKNGYVYISDTGNNRIVIGEFKGVSKYGGVIANYVTEWSEGIESPRGIAISTPMTAYVVNSSKNELLKISAGKIIRRILSANSLSFKNPTDVIIGEEGNIYLSDTGNNRIVIFNTDLSLNSIISNDNHNVHMPTYMSLDNNKTLFFADKRNGDIKMVSTLYSQSNSIPYAKTTLIDHEIEYTPNAIMVDGRYLWVTDKLNGKIILFRRKPY